MPATFPCPNPVCKHVFASEAIGAASLVCPLCGTVLQFRNSVPPPPEKPAPRPAVPPATTPAPPTRKKEAVRKEPPSATPVPAPPAVAARPPFAMPVPPPRAQPTVPIAAPVMPPPQVPVAAPVHAPVMVPPPIGGDPALNFESQDGGVVARSPRTRRQPLSGKQWAVRIAIWTILGGGVLAGAVWGVLLLRTWINQGEKPADRGVEGANYKLTLPDGWTDPGEQERARNIKLGMDLNLCVTRGNPSNRFGLYYRDYANRLPSEGELVDEALRKLRRNPADERGPKPYFTSVEWELRPREKVPPLGGQPAWQFEFQGVDADNVLCTGEVTMTAYRGYAYWLFTWGPLTQKEQIVPTWEPLRKSFSLGNEREGWVETPKESELVEVPGHPFHLRSAKDIWRRSLADGWDPAALVVLLGNDPTKSKHAGRAATLQVLWLPKLEEGKSLGETVKAYILAQQKVEYPETKIETFKDKDMAEVDGPADIGALKGHLMKLHVFNGEDSTRERYMLIGAVAEPDGILVLQFDADWNRRDFWDYEFTPLLKTLRKVKKAP
jgi:hypothetical protein